MLITGFGVQITSSSLREEQMKNVLVAVVLALSLFLGCGYETPEHSEETISKSEQLTSDAKNHSQNNAPQLPDEMRKEQEKRIQELIEYLGCLSKIRGQAERELKEIGEPAIKPLIFALKDKNASLHIRSGAADVLGEIGDKRAFLPLMEEFENQDSDIRSSAAVALGKIGGKKVLELLLQEFKNADSEIIRDSAAAGLGELGDKKAVEPLIKALKDKDYWVRSSAAGALGKIGDKRAVEPLLEALKKSEEMALVEALGQLGDSRAVEPIVEILESKIQKATSRRNIYDGTISTLTKALGNIGGPGAVKTLVKLLKKGRNSYEKECGTNALVQIGEPAVDILVGTLEDEDYYLRCRAAEILSKIGDKKALEPLTAALKDKDNRVRIAAAWALRNMGEVSAVEPLIEALKDSKAVVRSYVASALGKTGDRKSVEPLIEALKDDKEAIVRSSAAWALGKIRDKRAVGPLMEALKDEDLRVNSRAAGALANIGEPAVEPLIKALKDKNSFTQECAAKVLGNIGDKRAVGPLVEALKKGDWVCPYAAWALRKITKQDFGRSYKQWKQWYEKNKGE